MTQADLFGPEALPTPSPDVVDLAQRVPANIRFGTSTWTYDGWFGDVYRRRYRGPQPASRLVEYSRYPLFRTVGIDSAFYDPPSEEELASYARALPPGFPCVSKVWDRITAKRLGHDAPHPGVAWMRNPELLTGVHGEVLKRHGVAHVFNSWTEMPPIGEQVELGWTFSANFTVARALLKPGRRYSDAVKQFQPYDRVQEPLPGLRRDLLQLINTSLRRRIEAFILANNRAEGNAPGTIKAVARM